MQIQNALITGSFSYNGADLSNITSSNAYSASLSVRTTNLESTASSLVGASSSFSDRTTQVERTYASTGSNTFTGVQNFSNTCNPIGFNSVASVYTAGGLQVTYDSYFSSSVFVNGNLTVFGTQSVVHVSSSQFNIGTNIITVNTATPSIRYGGLSVYDSGSTGLSGSIFWDSEANHWIYANASGSGGGATYSGGMFISGPRSSGLGCEQGTTACRLLVGQGGDHLTSSLVYHDSTRTCFYSNALYVSSSGIVGIGAAPIIATAAALQIEQAQSNIVAIRRADCSNTGNSRILFQAYNASGVIQNTGIVESGLDNSTTNGYIGFYAGTGAMNMKITTAGNVGIGMNAPDAKLHICNAIAGGTDNYLIIVQNCCTVADARAGIAFSNNSQTPSAGGLSGASIQTSNNGIDGAGNLLFSTLISGASCERLRITSCGKVGIGACSPRWLLEICCNTSATGGGGYPAISINNPNDAGYSAYYFFKGANNFGGMEISNATCHIFVDSLSTFAIKTNGVERLRLNQNGGFGTQLCNFCLTGTYQTLVTVENGSYGLLMLSSCLGGGTYALYNIYNNAGVTSVNLIHGNNIPACVVGNAVRFASANSATYCDMRSSYIRFY
jgi:hypothetical protein